VNMQIGLQPPTMPFTVPWSRPSASVSWAVLEREKVQFDRIRFLSVGASTPVSTLIEQHKTILSAVRARDPNAAEAAMRAHMTEVLEASQTLLSMFPELIADEG
jgi:DNA-binding GntR family transcriptional regulator